MTAKRALVTGGTRGFGRAITAGLIARGHDVTITSRDADQGNAAAKVLGCHWAQVDLANPTSMMPLLEDPNGFDILINNAGILPQGSLIENPQGYFDAMAVMATAPFLLIRAFAPGMAGRGWGRVVNVSSGWGSFEEGLEGPNGYGVAKAALNALTKTLPRDLPECIKVNAMCPGWVRTRLGAEGDTKKPDKAVDTALWLSELPQSGPTGGFFRDKSPIAW